MVFLYLFAYSKNKQASPSKTKLGIFTPPLGNPAAVGASKMHRARHSACR